MAYDTPIPGFNTYNTNNLRLWRSRPRNTFDFEINHAKKDLVFLFCQLVFCLPKVPNF